MVWFKGLLLLCVTISVGQIGTGTLTGIVVDATCAFRTCWDYRFAFLTLDLSTSNSSTQSGWTHDKFGNSAPLSSDASGQMAVMVLKKKLFSKSYYWAYEKWSSGMRLSSITLPWLPSNLTGRGIQDGLWILGNVAVGKKMLFRILSTKIDRCFK